MEWKANIKFKDVAFSYNKSDGEAQLMTAEIRSSSDVFKMEIAPPLLCPSKKNNGLLIMIDYGNFIASGYSTLQ